MERVQGKKIHRCTKCGESGHNSRSCLVDRELTDEERAKVLKQREYRKTHYTKHGDEVRKASRDFVRQDLSRQAKINERVRKRYASNDEIKRRARKNNATVYARSAPNVGDLARLRSTPEWQIERRLRATKQKAKWRASNRERVRGYLQKYARRHPDRRRETGRRWRTRYPDRVKASNQRWAKNNPEKVRAKNLLRDYRSATAPGSASADQIRARAEFFGNACSYCGGPFEHMDHAIPLARGGTNWPANLRPACRSCNLTKCAKSVFEFIRARRTA